MVGRSLWDLAQEATVEHNPYRLALRVITHVRRHGQTNWDSALANGTRATQRVLGMMRRLAASGETFSVVGFSLGGRVLMSALRRGDPGPSLHRALFVAAATSIQGFSALPRCLRDGARVVNVFSDDDAVLCSLYPHVHGLEDAAGTRPAAVDGVENVRVNAGHLSYSSLAPLLVDLATRPRALSREADPPPIGADRWKLPDPNGREI